MKDCTACEAYQSERVSTYCDKHESLPKSYKKMIDRLYQDEDNCSFFQMSLRIYMLATWSIDQLRSLKFRSLEQSIIL